MDSGKWNLPARSPSPRSPHGPNPTVPMVNRRGGWPPRPPVLTSPCTYREGRGIGAGKIFHPKSCFGWKIRGSSSAHILFAPCSPLIATPLPLFPSPVLLILLSSSPPTLVPAPRRWLAGRGLRVVLGPTWPVQGLLLSYLLPHPSPEHLGKASLRFSLFGQFLGVPRNPSLFTFSTFQLFGLFNFSDFSDFSGKIQKSVPAEGAPKV